MLIDSNGFHTTIDDNLLQRIKDIGLSASLSQSFQASLNMGGSGSLDMSTYEGVTGSYDNAELIDGEIHWNGWVVTNPMGMGLFRVIKP
jgi:hypothetical protein